MKRIPVIHLDQWGQEGGAGRPWGISNSPTQLQRTKVGHQGHDQLSAHLRWVRELQSSGQAAGGCFDWCWLWCSDVSLVPLLFAHWARARRLEAKETTLPAPVCSISARYLSHSGDRWRLLHQQPAMPVGDDLLISVWFLHPALIEIHTASLAWLSLA